MLKVYKKMMIIIIMLNDVQRWFCFDSLAAHKFVRAVRKDIFFVSSSLLLPDIVHCLLFTTVVQ